MLTTAVSAAVAVFVVVVDAVAVSGRNDEAARRGGKRTVGIDDDSGSQ